MPRRGFDRGIEGADMIRFMSNMPIYRRLFIAFAFAAIISGVVIIVLGDFYVNSLTTQGQAVRTSFDAQSAASQQETNLQRMNAVLEAFHNGIFGSATGVIKDPSFFSSGALLDQEVRAREAQFDQSLKNYQANYELATSPNMSTVRSILLNDDPTSGTDIINSQQAALNSVANNLWPTYKADQDKVLKDLEDLQNELLAGNVPSAAQLNQIYNSDYETLYRVREDFTSLSNNWQNVVSASVDMGKTVTSVGSSQTNPVLIATVIAFMLSLLALIATGWIVNITITQPLRRLATLARRVAKGETKARAQLMGHDEIFMVASAMNNMLDNIIRLIQETQGQRDALQAQVEKLVSEVSGVGEGDLSVQAEVTADALGVLADSFNYMVEELSSLVVRVKMVAQEVDASTSSIFDRLTQLVETGDIQMNQIEHAAVEVEHMADSSRRTAERAQYLYTIAREARQSAQTGRESVQLAVEGMGRIRQNVQTTANNVQTLGERSREINNVVEVISNIAHQTNRLALDAAIQAAMAGENGKGFGAVAADIRRLAERAKEQTSIIARIVRAVRDDIGAVAISMQDTERETDTGSKLTQNAGTALESIFTAVERQAQEIEGINQVARQQLEMSSSIVQIMHAVSNSTQQSTVSTRETSQSTESLARLVEQLRASVEAFKLPDNQSYYGQNLAFNVVPETMPDEQLSISGAYRTVTAFPPANRMSGTNMLPPGNRPGPTDPFSFYPMAPNSGGNGNGFGYGNGGGAMPSPGQPQSQPLPPQQWPVPAQSSSQQQWYDQYNQDQYNRNPQNR
jgi:methyl-accepting chemotaxis protein